MYKPYDPTKNTATTPTQPSTTQTTPKPTDPRPINPIMQTTNTPSTQQTTPKQKSTKTTKIIIVLSLLFVFVLFLLGGAGIGYYIYQQSKDDNKNETTTKEDNADNSDNKDDTASENQDTEDDKKIYVDTISDHYIDVTALNDPASKGETIDTSGISWNLIDVVDSGSSMKSIYTDVGGTCVSQNGKFITITVQAQNNTDVALSFPTLYLVDENRNVFESSLSAFNCSDEYSIFTVVEPGEELTFKMIFDVPTDTKLFLEVSDFDFSDVKVEYFEIK